MTKKHLEFRPWGARTEVLFDRISIGWIIHESGGKLLEDKIYFRPKEGISYLYANELREIANFLDKLNKEHKEEREWERKKLKSQQRLGSG